MLNLSNPVREPESIVTIRFQDCDPFGHLNNARFIDYFMNARQDQLAEHYNLFIFGRDQMPETSWVVKRMQISYLRPAQVMEQVRIRTRMIHYTDKTLMVEGLMLDKEGKHLKAVSWVEFAYISLANGRPTNHSEELMELCRAIVVPQQYQPDGFNQRVELLRQHVKSQAPRLEMATAGPR